MNAVVGHPCVVKTRPCSQVPARWEGRPSSRPAAASIRRQKRVARASTTDLFIDSAQVVSDIMTADVVTCSPTTTVDDAVDMIVENKVTGLPVVDEDGAVVGVVSDFDLLAIDAMVEEAKKASVFPLASQDWKVQNSHKALRGTDHVAFNEVKHLIDKSGGKLVREVMTVDPWTITPDMDVNKAARILLEKKIRRLPVVDAEGRLLGILSRGNIVKAALDLRKKEAAS